MSFRRSHYPQSLRVILQKAEQILGVQAATLGGYSENDPDEMDRIFADAMFKQFHFKFRGRMEVYQVRTVRELDELDSYCLTSALFHVSQEPPTNAKIAGSLLQDERRFSTAVIDVKEVKPVDDCRHIIKDIGALAKFL